MTERKLYYFPRGSVLFVSGTFLFVFHCYYFFILQHLQLI